jgi:hypothetical protein
MFLHQLAAQAYPAGRDSAAARAAAEAARAQLLADAPADARALFEQRLALRERAETGRNDAH